MSDDIEHIRVWHRTWADSDKSELEALRAENARLRGLLTECADDLQSYVDHEYPENIRAQYPSIDRRWHRDMGLVLRVRSALERAAAGYC